MSKSQIAKLQALLADETAFTAYYAAGFKPEDAETDRLEYAAEKFLATADVEYITAGADATHDYFVLHSFSIECDGETFTVFRAPSAVGFLILNGDRVLPAATMGMRDALTEMLWTLDYIYCDTPAAFVSEVRRRPASSENL